MSAPLLGGVVLAMASLLPPPAPGDPVTPILSVGFRSIRNPMGGIYIFEYDQPVTETVVLLTAKEPTGSQTLAVQFDSSIIGEDPTRVVTIITYDVNTLTLENNSGFNMLVLCKP